MEKESILTRPPVMVTLALLCQGVWGTIFPIIKIGYEAFSIESVGDTFLFAGIRFLSAGLILLAIETVREKKLPVLNKRNMFRLFILGTVQTGAAYALQFTAMIRASSVNCSIINGAAVIMSTIFASIIFPDDPLTPRKIIGALTGFSGVLVCLLSDGGAGGFSFSGEGLMFLSMTVFALGTNMSRIVTRGLSPVTASGWNLVFGGAELLFLSSFLSGSFHSSSPRGWLSLIVLSGATCFCLLLWTALVKENSVSRVAVCQCINPITGVAAAALLLGENIMRPRYIISLSLVTLAIVITTHRRHHTRGKVSL